MQKVPDLGAAAALGARPVEDLLQEIGRHAGVPPDLAHRHVGRLAVTVAALDGSGEQVFLYQLRDARSDPGDLAHAVGVHEGTDHVVAVRARREKRRLVVRLVDASRQLREELAGGDPAARGVPEVRVELVAEISREVRGEHQADAERIRDIHGDGDGDDTVIRPHLLIGTSTGTRRPHAPVERGRVKGEPPLGVGTVEVKEGDAEGVRVERLLVIGDDVGDVEEDLVEPEALDAVTPRVRAQEAPETLRDVAEAGEVLAVEDDEVRADALGLGDQHQLADAAGPRHIVACREDALLLDAERLRPQGRALVLEDAGVEAVVVLLGGGGKDRVINRCSVSSGEWWGGRKWFRLVLSYLGWSYG